MNVAAGHYSGNITVSHGGNLASSTGYVVYRCSTMDACVVTGSSGFVINTTQPMPDYLMFDGFELVGSTGSAPNGTAYGQGIQLSVTDEQSSTAHHSSHHVWVLNNLIHGFGQSGVQMNDGEYFYVLHNHIYGNSHVTCDAQGSGISFAVPKAFTSYGPTADDTVNPNPLIGTFGSFHNVVAWNVLHGNALTQCGTASSEYDTDGEGIIMDTFDNQGTTNVLYPDQTLVAYNIAYQNGGRGIEVFRTSFVTVANNTTYDNMLDPFDNATSRGDITISGGHNNTVVNNIAYPIPATSVSDPRCQSTNPCYLMDNVAFLGGSAAGETDANNVWTHNISFGGTPPYVNQSGNAIFSPDTINCTLSGSNPNQCNVDPKLVNAASFNFALQTGSVAIGYGLSQTYLTGQPTDVGACNAALSSCP